MSGGGGSTQTIQSADPWVGTQPYLTEVMGHAGTLYNQGYGRTYYPGSTVVPFSEQTQGALSSIENRAHAGSPLTPATRDFTHGLLSQDMGNTEYGKTFSRVMSPANSNDATEGLLGRIRSDVRDAAASEFSAAGRYGSGKHAEALGRGISEGTAPILFSQYNTDRAAQLGAAQSAASAQSDLYGRQVQGAALAPQVAAMDYADASQLANVGRAYEGKDQELRNEAFDRYRHESMAPLSLLRDYYAPIVHGTAGLGGTTTGTQTPPSSGAGGAIGGALGGAAAGSVFGPWGAGIGAGIGLLGSIF